MTVTFTATIKGGLFEQYGVTLTGAASSGRLRRLAAQSLGKKGTLAIREILYTLDGAAAGSTATKSYARIEANVEQGGKRTIETESLVSRATVAGDVTITKHDLLRLSTNTTLGSSFPTNKDGNPLGERV